MSKLARRLADTRRWLDSIVIGQRLCPFAPPVRQPPALRLRASVAECSCGVAAELAEEAAALRLGLDSPGTEGSPETSLLVLGGTLDNGALGWRELIALSWKLQAEVIVDRGHAEHLQIVLFHPAATHSTYAEAGGPKGEIVVLAGPPLEEAVTPARLDAALREALADQPTKAAANAVADALGLPKREVYQRALQIKADG